MKQSHLSAKLKQNNKNVIIEYLITPYRVQQKNPFCNKCRVKGSFANVCRSKERSFDKAKQGNDQQKSLRPQGGLAETFESDVVI